MSWKPKIELVKLFGLSAGRSILFFAPLCSFFLFPNVSHAGLWASVAEFFAGQDASAQTETVIEINSQNIDLPEAATNIDPSVKIETEVIIDGGEALLPEVGPSNDEPNKIDNSNGQISIYTVRSGDSLAEIAEMFDVSINTILWANDLTKSSTIKPGQTLVILPMSGVLHTVAKGDTLGSIAKKYKGDVSEIANFNDMKISDKLTVGQSILIPDGQASSSLRPSDLASGSSRLISSGGPAYDGYYIKPFVGGHKTQGLHGYNAVDYGMSVGTEIYAAAPGVVIISKNSGWNGGYGNYVVIQHANNTQTVCAHLVNAVAYVGQKVSQGQLIGYSGNTGRSTGPHLHFEIRGAKNPF